MGEGEEKHNNDHKEGGGRQRHRDGEDRQSEERKQHNSDNSEVVEDEAGEVEWRVELSRGRWRAVKGGGGEEVAAPAGPKPLKANGPFPICHFQGNAEAPPSGTTGSGTSDFDGGTCVTASASPASARPLLPPPPSPLPLLPVHCNPSPVPFHHFPVLVRHVVRRGYGVGGRFASTSERWRQ